MSLKQGFGRRAGNSVAASSSHPILLCDLCVLATLRPHCLALSSSIIVSLSFLRGCLVILFCPFVPGSITFLDREMQLTPLCFFICVSDCLMNRCILQIAPSHEVSRKCIGFLISQTLILLFHHSSRSGISTS